MTRNQRDAINWIRDQGAADVELIHRGRHPRIYFTLDGQRRSIAMSVTPRCKFWFTHLQQEFRRLVRVTV
jgi:hypothetical protein